MLLSTPIKHNGHQCLRLLTKARPKDAMGCLGPAVGMSRGGLENLQEAIEKLRADVQEGASESSGASADPAQMEEMSRRQAKMVTQLKKMKEVITALKEKAQAQELEQKWQELAIAFD